MQRTIIKAGGQQVMVWCADPLADVRDCPMSCVSGYWGPWTRAETTFSNEYFKLMLVRGHKQNHPPLTTPSHQIPDYVKEASLVILPNFLLPLPGGEVDGQEDPQGQQVERPQAVRGQDRRAHDAARRPRAR